ncbi:MAG: ABC transporter substrate-binding protein [Patescibacteria group bacterium]
MRKYYWYFTAYWKKHGKTVIISVFTAIFLFSITLPFLVSKINTKKHFYIAMVGNHTLNSLPNEIEQLVSFGLTKLNKDGTVDPALSERWSIEENGKTYRFIIKKGLKWQDGKNFNPSDVWYPLEDTQIITTQNDVVFKLPDTFVPFPSFVSKPLFRSNYDSKWFFFTKQKITGLGRYQITDFKLQGKRLKEITLESSKEKRTIRFYLTQGDAITAFKSGDVDILSDLNNKTAFENWNNILLTETLKEDEYLALFFNMKNPLFSKNVRQAFSYALSKPEDKERALGPIDPNSWVYLAANKTYKQDQKRAIERLLSSMPEQKLAFSIKTTVAFSAEAEKIKEELENLGTAAFESCEQSDEVSEKEKCENLKISINIQVHNFPDLTDFETLLITRESPPDPDQYSMWHSQQASNFTNYKNTRIDNLLEKGRQVADREERKAIYQEFQQFLLEDAPAVFIKHPTVYEAKRK